MLHVLYNMAHIVGGYIRYPNVGSLSLYNVPSYVGSGYSDTHGDFSTDDYGNGRANTKGIKSQGSGRGGEFSAQPSSATLCVGGIDGDIQGTAYGSGAGSGFICYRPTPAGCPRVGGQEAVSVTYLDKSAQRLATDNAVQCNYDISAFEEPSAYDDWNRYFIELNEWATENQTVMDEIVLPNFCKGTSTECNYDPYTETTPETCSRFVASDTGVCRVWRDNMAEANPGKVNEAMTDYCDAYPQAGECSCIRREFDETYKELVSSGAFIGLEAGCWYVPCQLKESQLIPTDVQCTVDTVVSCNQYVNDHGNNGTIIIELGGTVSCDASACPGQTAQGCVEQGPTPENPTLQPVEEWPWWYWLLIAIGVLVAFGIIGAIIYFATRSNESEATGGGETESGGAVATNEIAMTTPVPMVNAQSPNNMI